MIRVGLVTAADDRAAAHNAWAMAALFDRTLVLDAGASLFPARPDRYPNPTVVPSTVPDVDQVIGWADGLDVVYFAGPAWHVQTLVRRAGVRTVLHTSPDRLTHQGWATGATDALWFTSEWRATESLAALEVHPSRATVVRHAAPIIERSAAPVDDDPDRPLRLLHLAGPRSAFDVRGTNVVVRAFRDVARPVEAEVVFQSEVIAVVDHPDHVALSVGHGGDVPWWDLLAGVDVVVAPRRLGAPARGELEAAACGVPSIVTDRFATPGSFPVMSGLGGSFPLPGGNDQMATPGAGDLARLIDHLGERRDLVRIAAQDAASWAVEQSMGVRAPMLVAALERVAERSTGGADLSD